MNALFFGFKRAHHSCLRVARDVAQHSGMTPARFDMMRVIAVKGIVRQSRLRRDLGVAASTTSRMVRSLEALGLVARERERWERRQISVSLTERGRALMRSLDDSAIATGLVQLAVDTALANGRATDKLQEDEMDSAMSLVGRFRRVFRDTADIYYPYNIYDPRLYEDDYEEEKPPTECEKAFAWADDYGDDGAPANP